MKIGIICYPTYGGSGVVATELGIELAVRGHEVHFITYAQPFRLTGQEERIHFHEVTVTDYPLFQYPPYDLALASQVVETTERYNLDLLHVHYAIPHAISALLARQMLHARGLHLPFITTLHGTDITLVGFDRSYLPITRFGIEQSDGVTAISRHLAQHTNDAFVTGKEIKVIHNFVNCELYIRKPEHTTARLRYAQPNEKILIHLSNFRKVKRVVDVIETFARVAREVPSRLLMIGDGPERAEAQWRARQLGVIDRVDFLGKQDQVYDLLPVADLMILPSEMESFGLAALEAMACSVPVVAARVGGIPELVEDGINGFLLPVGDVDNMARAALSVLRNDEKLAIMSQAARNTAVQRFSTPQIIPQYERYYEESIRKSLETRQGSGVEGKEHSPEMGWRSNMSKWLGNRLSQKDIRPRKVL